MKVTQWEAGDNPNEECGRMALITKGEALQIICSLTQQIQKLNDGLDSNDVRIEFYPHDDKYGYFSIAVVDDPEALFRGAKVGNIDCVCDYAESGLCDECPGNGSTPVDDDCKCEESNCLCNNCVEKIVCEICGQNCQNCSCYCPNCAELLDRGRCSYCERRCLEEQRKFSSERYDCYLCKTCGSYDCACEESHIVLCERCGDRERFGNDTLCLRCVDNDLCEKCLERYDNCACGVDEDYDCLCSTEDDVCSRCYELHEDCECGGCTKCSDEFDEEFVCSTFRSMNAFDRARWIRAQGE